MRIERQQLNKLMGIYAIKYLNGSKVYIGSAKDLYKRGITHQNLLQKNLHHSLRLQNAWNQYGEDAFDFIVIESLSNVNRLIEREQYWIDHYNSSNTKFGYNINPIAGSTLGAVVSIETRKKLSKIHKDKPLTAKHRKKISLALTGRVRSKEHSQKISIAQKGTKLGKDNPFFGKKHSSETIQKIIVAHLGIKRPDQSLRMTGKDNPRFNPNKLEEQG